MAKYRLKAKNSNLFLKALEKGEEITIETVGSNKPTLKDVRKALENMGRKPGAASPAISSTNFEINEI